MAVTRLVPLTDDTGQAAMIFDREKDWKPRERRNGEQMIDDTHLPLIMFKKLESAVSKNFDESESPTDGCKGADEIGLANASEGEENEPEPAAPRFKYPTPPRELLRQRWDPHTSWKPDMDRITPDEAMKRSPEALMRQLQEIQQYRTSRDLVISWATNLKFLTGGPTSSSDPAEADPARSYFKCSCRWEDRPLSTKLSIPCSCRSLARPFDPSSKSFSLIRLRCCPHYVAISYRWQNIPPDGKIIISHDGQQKPATAPSSVLLRAATFARHHGYQLLWCDQESIDQSNRADKEPGIQAMDIVYEKAEVCLAPLDVEIGTQDQLHALAIATKPGPFPKWDSWIEWIEEMPWETLLTIAEVSQKIASDPWFSRSWIFQESTTAYATMLLIKCGRGLSVPEHLGSLAGEIEIPFCLFRLVICKLLLTFQGWLRKAARYSQQAAYIRNRRHRSFMFDDWEFGSMDDEILEYSIYLQSEEHNSISNTCKEWVEILRDFVLHTLPQWVHGKRYFCSALEACQRLAKRENETVADRLAILSNICEFDVRLDSGKLVSLGYDLAACVLCVAILNGDLSLVRLEDGTRYSSFCLTEWETLIVEISTGRADGSTSFVDLQTGPPLFSWAPRLIEGLTESRLAGQPGRNPNSKLFRYHFLFQGPNKELYIKGWLWKFWRSLDVPELAKHFYRRRFGENGWANRYDYPSEFPTSRCNLEDCCKMTDPLTVKQCFWDLMQYLLEEDTPELAESLWVSLLISERNQELQGDECQEDPRRNPELRGKIHTISFEEFSKHVTLPNIRGNSTVPQFWIIQKVIHMGQLDIWGLSNGIGEHAGQKPSYTFFSACDKLSIFTPHRTPRGTLSWNKALDLQQYCFSWPVMAAPMPNDPSQVAVSIHPTKATPGPIKGFWNVDDKPPELYALQ